MAHEPVDLQGPVVVHQHLGIRGLQAQFDTANPRGGQTFRLRAIQMVEKDLGTD